MESEKSDEANNFVKKIKADGSERDMYDLGKVYNDYKCILCDLPAKYRGSFSLSVLCTLCRNLDKVPLWRERISNKDLLELSIDCLRQTRVLETPDQVKTLACVYHIHRHAVRMKSSAPPELMLKLSYMPFEVNKEYLLKEHAKAYWSILADRFTYIEKLKSNRMSIVKLLPKLSEDIITVISVYDPVQFCASVLEFVVKKLHFLYSDSCVKDLSGIYGNIFQCIAKANSNSFKNITEKETSNLYLKFNECLYIIIENDSKLHFKKSSFDATVRTMISLLGHDPAVFHCFQTFYLNCFCCIFNDKADSDYMNAVLRSLQVSCETTEKMGYQKAIYTIYPFIAQLLRLFIEYFISNSVNKMWNKCFNLTIQDNCLKLMLFLTKKLSKTKQLSKCDNCSSKSGLHDALRLTFLIKNFVTTSISESFNLMDILPSFYEVVKLQYTIIAELKKLGCSNHSKCLRKLQTDIHNTAIALNKAQSFEYSIKLFNLYLKNEIWYVKTDTECKNICRAFYNKSISELDCKLYEDALKSAYLSLAFSVPEGLTSDKYMSLVMDIKAKALKSGEEKREETEEDQEGFQLLTILSVCKMLAENNDYGNLKPFLSMLKFSSILKHEFSMYEKLWPSMVPIAGVWSSLNELVKDEQDTWISVENEETVVWTLYEVVLETPNAVRTIHFERYRDILKEVLQRLDRKPEKSVGEMAVHASLLFLQSEYDIAETTQQFGWKASEAVLDPEQQQASRTLPQEHQALRCAVRAVHIWTEILPQLNAGSAVLQHCLRIAEVFVRQFLHMYRYVYALQLAHVCCGLSQMIGDKEAYIRNAGVILLRARKRSSRIDRVASIAIAYWTELMQEGASETALTFACELAMFYHKCGSALTAAKLVQLVQARMLEALDKEPEMNLDLSLGRLLEAQALVSGTLAPSSMSAVIAIQRHYATATNSETRWCLRRTRALTLKRGVCRGGELAVRLARDLRLWRRARAAAAAALPACGALPAAALHAALVDAHAEHAHIKIDNRLKHILGLQPTNEIRPYTQHPQTKYEPFTPKAANLETMLDCMSFKKIETSPSLPCITIPAFKMPEFLTHEESCSCYACDAPYSSILAFQTCTLEASVYYRNNEHEIARNYFAGASEALRSCEAKLQHAYRRYASKKIEKYILEIVKDVFDYEVRNIEVEMLIEASYYELSQGDYCALNEKFDRIYQIITDIDSLNPYLDHEVNNLLIATATLRRVSKKREEVGLETEMENLRLSPSSELAKTPENKCVPVKEANKLVRSEEVPTLKRKVIKLNLDDDISEETEPMQEVKKPNFKVPAPVTALPVLETITPRPSRTRPKLLLTQATVDRTETPTPTSEANSEFFTPSASTPVEQFFTPMTSLKTYSRKHCGIVKNLENEFSTPKAAIEKEKVDENSVQPKTRAKAKVESGSVKSIRDKRSLKRATSPGKLTSEGGSGKGE